jgi:predicted DNA-binding ArsR family transcriptional regulator
VADFSELTIQITLTVAEMRDLVALVNLATDAVLAAEQKVPDIVEEISTMYFELMENLKDGFLGDFQPG